MERVYYLTQEEVTRLLETIRKSGGRHAYRDFCMFRVAYRCGLRASEVGLIRVDYFNPQTHELYCKRLKNSHSNTIRLDEKTARALKRYIKSSGKSRGETLFVSQRGLPVSRQILDRKMRQYCREARIPDPSRHHFHVFKHSVAVHLAESGLDLKELQYYLGHKSVSSTIVYFRFTTSQQEEMYRKLNNGRLV